MPSNFQNVRLRSPFASIARSIQTTNWGRNADVRSSLDSLKSAILCILFIMIGASILIVLLVIVLTSYLLSGVWQGNDVHQDISSDWMQENSLTDLKHTFSNIDFTYKDFIQLHLSSQTWNKLGTLSSTERQKVTEASKHAAERIAVEMWLKQNRLEIDYAELNRLELGSVWSLANAGHSQIESIVSVFHYSMARTNYHLWTRVISKLKQDLQKDPHFESQLINQFLGQSDRSIVSKGSGLLYRIFMTGLIMLTIYMAAVHVSNSSPSSRRLTADGRQVSMTSYLTGTYLAPQKCHVKWCWEEPCVVGRTLSFEVFFVMYNGKPYPISEADNIIIDISRDDNKINTTEELGLSENGNIAKVSFSVIQSGNYWIKIRVGGWDIAGSPFNKIFDPGPPVPGKTWFTPHNSTIVLTSGVPYILYIEPRDEFSNVCKYNHVIEVIEDYTVQVVEANGTRNVAPHTSFAYKKVCGLIEMSVIIQNAGCFQMKTFYKGEKIQNGKCNTIVLSGVETAEVQRHVSKESHNIYYKSQLLSSNVSAKSRKVYCYISPRQLTIKEFYFRIFPKRLHTFRVCPSTKFEFKGQNGSSECTSPDDELKGLNSGLLQTVIIDDGTQPPVQISSKYVHMIVATFTSFLLKNIGGSETFKDKQDFFYCELRRIHQKYQHSSKSIQVQRTKLLESSIKAIESFSLNDWLKRFEIQFIGEEGLDWGGVRREWFELICCALFDPTQSGLFKQYKDDSQGLCLPNPSRPDTLKLKHYELAGKIVGKCLYESALGGSYYQAVKAKFARSFLAQLIGLRVNYKYFEQDDPDLYVSKIKYFEENDPEEMDVYFVEEEYNSTGQLVRTVDLCPGGSSVQVTKENKMKYLDALAQYRLVGSVRDEVDRFLKGLNEIVPDNLLSIFDENELELLMCGTGECKVADLKAHHIATGFGPRFAKTLDWFWTIVGSFNQEQMARLLQFTTGSSQLPPEGFAALCPNFQISPLPTYRGLPTAHTCFNQLCLPDYNSIEDFHQALLLAINEGSQGFGFA